MKVGLSIPDVVIMTGNAPLSQQTWRLAVNKRGLTSPRFLGLQEEQPGTLIYTFFS